MASPSLFEQKNQPARLATYGTLRRRGSRYAGLVCIIVLLHSSCCCLGLSAAEKNPASETTTQQEEDVGTCTFDNDEDALLEWFRSKGGYWNPKQAHGRDRNDLLGVFAVEAIEKGELLASVPWDVVIASGTHRFDDCETVRLLGKAMNKTEGDFSVFASSLKASAKEHSGLLPAFWSPEGQALLNEVLDNGKLPPEDMFMRTFQWKQNCEQIDTDATVLALTHGEGFGMVPVANRYNNGGGSRRGARFTDYWGEADVALKVKATRALQAGEEIVFDYKKDMDGAFGTPELLKWYGFVESYPQHYVFHNIGLAFDIDKTDNGYIVNWREEVDDEDTTYMGYPNQKAISFLGRHLDRLQNLYPRLVQKEANLPAYEFQVITHFCRDLITAFERAILDCFANGIITFAGESSREKRMYQRTSVY